MAQFVIITGFFLLFLLLSTVPSLSLLSQPMFSLLRKNKLYTKTSNIARKMEIFVPALKFRDILAIQELRDDVSLDDSSNNGKILNFCQKLVNNEIMIDHPWPTQKRFLTKPKEYIISQVQAFVQAMVKNNYVATSGTSARLLYGEKGIGKSCSLTLAVMATYMTYENVIPIYIEYAGVARNYITPSRCLSDALGMGRHLSIRECIEKLEAINCYSILIVDEIDQIYTCTDERTLRLDILHELCELGTQTSGRIFTIICGSSSVTPSLISKSAVHNKDILSRYPLVADCPNLNGSKFRALRLSTGSTKNEDYDIVQSALNISPTNMNILYFLAGSNLRNITDLFNEIVLLGQKYTTEKCLDLFNPSATWGQTGLNTYGTDPILTNALNSALVAKNYKIIKKLYRAIENQRPSAINDTKWLQSIKPLKLADINRVLESIRPNYDIANPAPTLLTINLLIDRGYYSGPSNSNLLYPTKPIDLLHHFPFYENELRKKSYFSKIKTFWGIQLNEFSQEELPRELRLRAAEYILKGFF